MTIQEAPSATSPEPHALSYAEMQLTAAIRATALIYGRVVAAPERREGRVHIEELDGWRSPGYVRIVIPSG